MMNKELQDRLLEYLGSLDGAVRQAGGFVAEQAPLVAQELIDWTFWSGVVGVVVFSLLAVLFFWIARRCARRMDDIENNPLWTFGCLLGSCLFVACLAGVVVDGRNALQAKVAPRVVILEAIADMAKQANR